MPESVDIPAPVSTATRRPCSRATSSGASTPSRVGDRPPWSYCACSIPCGPLNHALPMSTQALLRNRKLGAHVALHHSQRRIPQVGVDVGDAVFRHDHMEMPDVGVQRGVEDALLSDLTGQDQSVWLELTQQICQRCRVEGAVSHLLQEQFPGLRHYWLNEVGPLTFECLADQILLVGGEVAVVVIDVDDVDVVALARRRDQPRDGIDLL